MQDMTTEGKNVTFDVIIVGAGSAGCVLAARLSENPACEVLLLEAGPDYPTRAQLPRDIADGSRLLSEHNNHDWGFMNVLGSRGVPPLPLPRGRIVGGSSAVNGTFALRGFPEDYDAWQAAGNEDWGFSNVLEVFRRLEIAAGRACGVRLVGGEVLRGDLVVLAAGAYASPAVLLRSGIGPADELRALGVDPVVDLPGVGRNLVDHPLVSVNVPVPAEPVARAHYQTMVTWRSDGDNNAGNGPPDLHLFACGPFDTEGTADSQQEARLIIGLVDPASRGRVRLTSADPTAPPHIDLGYLTDPRDAEYLVAGVREARRILDTEPLRSLVSGPELSPSEEVTDDAALRAKLPQLVRTYHHPVGTCRMGTDPDGGAVVDAHGRLHGVDNLAVVDASIMPRIPRANTNLPTMMLAERIAGWLTDQT